MPQCTGVVKRKRMDCVLLGSGGMMPMPYRFLTSLIVRLQGRLYLFDAGEGSQINLKKTKMGIKSLRVIAISHLHGDHCLGLPGLLMMRAQVTDPDSLTILGPPGIERFVSQLHELLGYFINYPIKFVEWHEGCLEVAYEDDLVRMSWGPLNHTTFCLGYRLEEHPRPGRFKPEAAHALGVPQGPLWRRLQWGEKVTLDGGMTVSPLQVVGQPRSGRRICYAVDTRPTQILHSLCQDADIAFLDGMFLLEHRPEAEEKGHMTVDDAARVAASASARRVVLVHISPRYKEEDIEKLTAEATQQFDKAEVGRDLQRYSVSYPKDEP